MKASCRCRFFRSDIYVGWLLLAMTKTGQWCHVDKSAMLYCCWCGKLLMRRKDKQ